MRQPARAGELADVAAAEKLPLSIHELDVDSDPSVQAAFASIGEQIDALVNNAGLGMVGAIPELPLEAFRASMETNYLGPLRCIHAVPPRMRQARRGCIVNISSVAGRAWSAPFGPYAPTKAALEALSEIIAGELRADNIRVAIVQPGVIDTAMAHKVEAAAPLASGLDRRGVGGHERDVRLGLVERGSAPSGGLGGLRAGRSPCGARTQTGTIPALHPLVTGGLQE